MYDFTVALARSFVTLDGGEMPPLMCCTAGRAHSECDSVVARWW